MSRPLLALLLLLPIEALAGSECADAYSECRDDCLVEFGGSVRVEMKKRYEKCMKKCSKEAKICSDRHLELEATEPNPAGRHTAPVMEEPAPRPRKQEGSERQPTDDEPRQAPQKGRATSRERLTEEAGERDRPEPDVPSAQKQKKVDDSEEPAPRDAPKKNPAKKEPPKKDPPKKDEEDDLRYH